MIVEGNDGADMGDTPCLWRELALAKFPRLRPLVEAVRASSKADPKRSWKGLYRVHSDAHGLSRDRMGIGSIVHRPKTSWNDYFLTVEFREYNDDLLFVASGRGCRTSPLWQQEIDYDEDWSLFCKGPLDTKLSSRLGSSPFDEKRLRCVTARVLVTRLSDMSVVELGTLCYKKDEDNDDGDLEWDFFDPEDASLPVGVAWSRYANKPVHAYLTTQKMKLRLTPKDGTVLLFFEEWCQENDEWAAVKTKQELAYLEMHCPWPVIS